MKIIFRMGIVAMLSCLIGSADVLASDFDTILKRMFDRALINPAATDVKEILDKMDEKGGFVGIDYRSHGMEPRTHLYYLHRLAASFQHPENVNYRNPELKDAYFRSLNFWVDTNHQADNWWVRYIAYPKDLSKSLALMAKELRQDKVLLDKVQKYLRYSFEASDSSRISGANGTDIIIGSMLGSVLTENDAQMVRFRDEMTGLLSIQPVNGVQRDYLFAQHCGNGRQLYVANYGKEFVNSALNYLELCENTKYQTGGVELLQQLFINGVQWIYFNRNYDPNNSGRFISSENMADQVRAIADRLSCLKSPLQGEMKKVCARLEGKSPLEGNRMFWRFDYMVHRRANYMTSSRAVSTRTVGNEAGNGSGELNYYSSNGVNYIFVTGKEYARDYFKKFNYRQFPGITAEQDTDTLPVPYWGQGGSNGNMYAGGVSNGVFGACGMILDRRGVKAHKSWFYFDQEFVCLGAGISEKQGKAPVYTTINQTNLDGTILYAQNGKVATLTAETVLAEPDWVLHGKIGYFNLASKTEYRIAEHSDLFSLNINHGINPEKETYVYLVKPDVQSAAEMSEYKKKIPVRVIANTEKVQAVRHEKLKITEIIFYCPGKLEVADGYTVAVDHPCALLWDEAADKISIANPRCESENPPVVQVTVSRRGQVRSTRSFAMPQEAMAGSTVTDGK